MPHQWRKIMARSFHMHVASQAARKCSKVDMDEPNIIMFITSFGKRTERHQMMRIPITTTSITRSLMVSAIGDLKHFIHLLLSARNITPPPPVSPPFVTTSAGIATLQS
jgi:hypothetical protein